MFQTFDLIIHQKSDRSVLNFRKCSANFANMLWSMFPSRCSKYPPDIFVQYVNIQSFSLSGWSRALRVQFIFERRQCQGIECRDCLLEHQLVTLCQFMICIDLHITLLRNNFIQFEGNFAYHFTT